MPDGGEIPFDLAANMMCDKTSPPLAQFHWIIPPWRDREETEDGDWPWVGDQFLAAVKVRDTQTNREYWEFTVLTWSETGLECNGDHWGAWDEKDIDWIARIPIPHDVVKITANHNPPQIGEYT